MSKPINNHIIKCIYDGGVAWEIGMEPGDEILSINGESFVDVFDYDFLMLSEYVEVLVRKPDGEEIIFEIEKDENEDLGIEFENGLMDAYRHCSNKCIFCFIDQMPGGMRDTLYFKDDDSRLSFLQGNYVTLTNMNEEKLDRIIKYKMSPINVSIHAMDPEVRFQMLKNPNARKLYSQMKKLYDAGITMNGQIVLCKGYNDGEVLKDTIEKAADFLPLLESLSIVPVGLTKFRDDLCELEPFTKEDALWLIDTVHGYQERFMKEYDTHFVHASDEWYILAEKEVPEEDTYDGYLQLENGVGMLRLFKEEFEETFGEIEYNDKQERNVDIATGVLAYDIMSELSVRIMEKYPNVHIKVHVIKNDFFGEKITVSGLLTGGDIIKQLKGKMLSDHLLLPENVLRAQRDLFLDDISIQDVEDELNADVDFVSGGSDLVIKILEGCTYE